jgi:hypothetical protein
MTGLPLHKTRPDPNCLARVTVHDGDNPCLSATDARRIMAMVITETTTRAPPLESEPSESSKSEDDGEDGDEEDGDAARGRRCRGNGEGHRLRSAALYPGIILKPLDMCTSLSKSPSIVEGKIV